MRSMTFKVMLAGCLAILATAGAEEILYLQKGEEYRGRLKAITSDGQVRFITGGEERSWPLSEVDRIDFERDREFGGADNASELGKMSPVLAEALKHSPEDLSAAYPEAGAVTIIRSVEITLHPGGAWERTVHQVHRILAERGEHVGTATVYFFPEREEAEVLHGLTVSPDGKVLHLSDAALKDEAIYGGQPAYDHLHRLRFTLRGANPGALVSTRTRTTGKADILHPFTFEHVFVDTDPALKQAVTITVEDGAGMPDMATLEGLEQASRENAGTARKLTWTVEDSPQIISEPMMPPMASLGPRLVLSWPEATWAGVAEAWREEMTRRHGAGADAVDKALATIRKVAGGEGESDQQKLARDAFEMLRTEIKLVDIPPGNLPPIPAAPGEVLERGYGTRLEKAVLLSRLLTGLGIQAEAALVRPRGSGPLAESVARLDGFSLAAVRCTLGEGETWLEPAGEDAGFGELAAALQGGQALASTTGEFLILPDLPPEEHGSVRRLSVAIKPDGSARITDTTEVRGATARGLRGLRQMTDQQFQVQAARLAASHVPGATLVKASHSDLARPTPVETLTLVYDAPAVAQQTGEFLMLKLPGLRYNPAEVGSPRRRFDLFWPDTDYDRIEAAITVPDGFVLYAAPDPTTIEHSGWAYKAASAQTEAGAAFEATFVRSVRAAPIDAYPALQRTLFTRAMVLREWLVFRAEDQ